MARISSYRRDELLRAEDQFIISSYEGEGQNGPIYVTNAVTLDELSNYLNLSFTIGEVNYNLNSMSSSITANTSAIATANTSITTNATNISANSTYSTNLASTFGTFDSSGNLTSLSQSFADSVITTTASDRFATSSALTSLTSTVTSQGNTISGHTTSIANAESNITTNANSISSNASSITSLNTSVSNKPDIFRQDDAPAVTNAVGSIWYDTNDNNKVYVLVAGSPNVWTLTADDRIITNSTAIASANTTLSSLSTTLGAEAALIDELQTQFTFDTNGGITGTADALATSITTASSNAAGAVASDLDKLETQFTFDTNGNVDGVSGALNTSISTAQSNAESASASKVDSLAANFFTGYDNTDGTFTAINISEAFANEVFTTTTNTDFATSSSVTTLSSTVSNKPDVFRQDAQPATTGAEGSIWYDTDDDNKVYVLVDVSGTKTWTLTTDGRIVTNSDAIATANSNISTLSTNLSAEAAQIDELKTQFSFNANDEITGVADALNTAIDTAQSDAESASATKINTLAAKFFTNYNNETGAGTLTESFANDVFTTTTNTDFASSSSVTSLTSVVATKPLTFRQDDAPATTNPTGSIWFDSNDNNKVYILVDNSGTKTWTVTDDNRLTTIPTIFRQDAEPGTSGVAAGSLWYDTNDENKLYVLSGGSWTVTRDTKITTNSSNISTNTTNISNNTTALSQRSRVFRQNDEPGTSGVPANSLWYDTNDNNKLYVFNGTSWVLTDDSRIGNNVTAISNVEDTADTNSTNITSNANKITEIESQFTFSGTDITGVADALSTSISNTASSAAGAVASDLDKLEAVFSFDSNGDVDGTSGALSTAITTSANAAISNADLASASSVDELETQFTFNASNEITGVADALNTAINTAQSNAESSSATKIETLASNFFTGYDSDDGTFTATSVSEAFANEVFTTTTNTDFASSTALNTLSSRVDDTEADISTNQSAIATVEGYAESRYSIQATAGNVVTGMSILAADGTTTDISQVVFQTDKFLIKSSTTEATPFILDSGQLKLNVPLNGVTGSFSGTLSAADGNIGGWVINDTELKSPEVSGVSRVELDPSKGVIINDSAGDEKLQVRTGALSSNITLNATFSTINNIEFSTWSDTLNTQGTISEQRLYKTTGTTYILAGFGSGDRSGTYTETINLAATTGGHIASTNSTFNGYIVVSLHVQIATDSSFNNIVGETSIGGNSVIGSGVQDIDFESTATGVSFSLPSSSSNAYLRFYWKRSGYLASGGVTFTGNSFNVTDTNLVFAKQINQTELTDQGFQVISSGNSYFKVDRANASINAPFVEIAGGLEVDGDEWDFTKYNSYTGSSSTILQKHYQKLPSGMIIQWGYQTGTVEDVTVTFPISFPSNCSSVGVTTNRTSKGSSGDGHAYNVSRTSFVAVTDSPNDFWWYALGW